MGANTGALQQLHQRKVAIALGAFMSWVVSNPQYKVTSMLARLRGAARRHKAMGIEFVSLSLVVLAADGLIQEHIDTHGADSLLPKSKKTFDTWENVGMLSVSPGTRICSAAGMIEVGDNIAWQGIVVWITLFCTMGCRKEAIALRTGEVFNAQKLSLFYISYRYRGMLHRSLSREQLNSFSVGDIVYITPCPCKNDRTGLKYGNSPVPAAWHPVVPYP